MLLACVWTYHKTRNSILHFSDIKPTPLPSLTTVENLDKKALDIHAKLSEFNATLQENTTSSPLELTLSPQQCNIMIDKLEVFAPLKGVVWVESFEAPNRVFMRLALPVRAGFHTAHFRYINGKAQVLILPTPKGLRFSINQLHPDNPKKESPPQSYLALLSKSLNYPFDHNVKLSQSLLKTRLGSIQNNYITLKESPAPLTPLQSKKGFSKIFLGGILVVLLSLSIFFFIKRK